MELSSLNNEEKLVHIRDPLFVIGTSLEIIKQTSKETEIKTELERIESALNKIGKIIN